MFVLYECVSNIMRLEHLLVCVWGGHIVGVDPWMVQAPGESEAIAAEPRDRQRRSLIKRQSKNNESKNHEPRCTSHNQLVALPSVAKVPGFLSMKRHTKVRFLPRLPVL